MTVYLAVALDATTPLAVCFFAPNMGDVRVELRNQHYGALARRSGRYNPIRA